MRGGGGGRGEGRKEEGRGLGDEEEQDNGEEHRGVITLEGAAHGANVHVHFERERGRVLGREGGVVCCLFGW